MPQLHCANSASQLHHFIHSANFGVRSCPTNPVLTSICGFLLLRSSLGEICQSFAALVLSILNDTCISIAAEVSRPLDKGRALKLSAGDRVETDGADNAGVAQSWLGGDDGVGNGVVDTRVLLLLDLQNVTILECPLDDVRLLTRSLDILRRLQCSPEVGKVLELDVVPDVGEGGFDDGGFLY